MINPKQNHLQPSQVYLSVFSFFQSLHVIKSSNHLGPSSRTGPLNSRVLVLSGQLRLNIAGQGSRTPKSVRYLRWKVKICPKRGFLLKESHHSQESEKLNLEACNLLYIYIWYPPLPRPILSQNLLVFALFCCFLLCLNVCFFWRLFYIFKKLCRVVKTLPPLIKLFSFNRKGFLQNLEKTKKPKKQNFLEKFWFQVKRLFFFCFP